jgi:hypothetical protein
VEALVTVLFFQVLLDGGAGIGFNALLIFYRMKNNAIC